MWNARSHSHSHTHICTQKQTLYNPVNSYTKITLRRARNARYYHRCHSQHSSSRSSSNSDRIIPWYWYCVCNNLSEKWIPNCSSHKSGAHTFAERASEQGRESGRERTRRLSGGEWERSTTEFQMWSMKLILDALSYPLDIIMFDKINLFGPTISIQHVKTILCASKSIINDVFQLFFKYFNQLYKCANVKKSVLWVNFLKKDKTQRQRRTCVIRSHLIERKREKKVTKFPQVVYAIRFNYTLTNVTTHVKLNKKKKERETDDADDDDAIILSELSTSGNVDNFIRRARIEQNCIS